jgi:glycosyltransferase involved in cell wall biosynthesis
MKLLISALSARRGGGQTYLINLLQHAYLADFVEIIVLAPARLVLPQHPRVRRLPTPRFTENPFVRAAWEFIRLPALVRRLGVDVLFVPGGLLLASLRPHCRSVTMFRNMLPFDAALCGRYRFGWQRLRNRILRRMILRSMREADLVIFPSECACRFMEDLVPLGHAAIIPHGLPEVFRRGPPPPRSPWAPRGDYLLYVSAVEVHKSHLEVVRAFHLLSQRRTTRETLVLAGFNETPHGRRVRREIERLGLATKVLMPGEVPYAELPSLYAHAKLNLFASECESFSNILVEALGSGRPLLAADRPVMREVAGNAPQYFEAGEPAALADALYAVLMDDARLARMAEAAAAEAARYSWKRTAQATWRAVSSILPDARAVAPQAQTRSNGNTVPPEGV